MYGSYSGGATLAFSENGQPAAASSLSTVSVVPEPSTQALLLAGFGLVGIAARRRLKR